ncbi:hypothetical protein THRCLA_01545 [Thraustotheca clavata]|uniref:Secreted protein n=1 Tax=Thraustotheca clavata TaxID=74557 RepID=A0A0A7CLW2_9STRA|nr:secreted protein [Thraustotheca clavata]OQS06421.1 hypothetical protein THRCLA_01545 [Thraustotheca clavata]
MVTTSCLAFLALLGFASAGSCPNAPRSDGRCGPDFSNAGCVAGSSYPCCSKYGWCGNGAGYCDTNICDSASASSCPNAARPDNRCGLDFGNAGCVAGSNYPCCSKYGWCGNGAGYCDTNICGIVSTPVPTSGGSCPNAARSDGRCGPDFGNAGCVAGSNYPCCSKYGWCGNGAGYCDNNICGTSPQSTPGPTPSNGVPILVNLAVPSHVGVDCPGIQSRWPTGTYFCGSPKPPGSNVYTPSCDQKMTVSYQGKSVTCVISFQAAGVGLTTGAYVELAPEAYAVLTGSTYGGQFTGATCTGVCNVARN